MVQFEIWYETISEAAKRRLGVESPDRARVTVVQQTVKLEESFRPFHVVLNPQLTAESAREWKLCFEAPIAQFAEMFGLPQAEAELQRFLTFIDGGRLIIYRE